MKKAKMLRQARAELGRGGRQEARREHGDDLQVAPIVRRHGGPGRQALQTARAAKRFR